MTVLLECLVLVSKLIDRVVSTHRSFGGRNVRIVCVSIIQTNIPEHETSRTRTHTQYGYGTRDPVLPFDPTCPPYRLEFTVCDLLPPASFTFHLSNLVAGGATPRPEYRPSDDVIWTAHRVRGAQAKGVCGCVIHLAW